MHGDSDIEGSKEGQDVMFSIEVAASRPIEQSDKQENSSSSYTNAA